MNSTTPTDPGSGSGETRDRPGSRRAPRRPSRRPSRRLVALLAGVVFLLTGLGALGYVAWEYVGTDVVARHRQADIRADLRALWEYPTVADVLGPQATGAALGDAYALLRIPRFGADYEVPVIEGVRDEDLSQGVGHFPGTGPGQIGNFALAGHRATNGEPFRDLADLRPGDRVMVETADATYTYELDTDPNDLVISFGEGWVTDPVPVAPDDEAPPGMPTSDSGEPTAALLTLTSSAELFHGDDRMVAFGHLVSITPK